eukprot:83816_1
MSLYMQQEDEDDAYNEPWPHQIINNSNEIEGIMHSNNMNGNDDIKNNNNERSGHKRQFTDVMAEALSRDDVKGWISPYMSIFTIGGGIGFAAGVSAKKMGTYVLKTTIGSLLIIQALKYKGYVDINYNKITNDVNSYMAAKENESYMQFLLANIGPVLAGFGLGFHLG